MKKPVVSVEVITYNQEKFIIQALDSITMQKTNFPFEVVIGIDHSPDHTGEILKKYKNKNKNCTIRIIDREKNLGPTRNEYETLKLCKGKYVAFLEGDDYWIDDQKLQIQYDFLESHPEYSGVAHDVNDVTEDGKLIMKHSDHYNTHKKIVKFRRLEQGHLDFHTNSLFARNIFFDKGADFSIIYKASPITCDKLIPMFLVDRNPIYIMKEVMSCYRFCENRYHDTYLEHTMEMLEFSKKINGYPLKNHKIDYSIKISRSIVLCLYMRVFKPEKNTVYRYRQLWSYINPKIFFLCILQIFVVPITTLCRLIMRKVKSFC